jgi:spore germination protein GerM
VNSDPFDFLRARNPVRPESLPDAPMTVATRITTGRPTLRRGLAIAGATAVAVLATGSAWLLWAGGGGSDVAIGVTTTTLSGTSTTAATPTTASSAPVYGTQVVVYFLDANTNTLVPVARDLTVLNARPLPALGPLTIELLLSGPGAWDAAPLPDPVADAEAQMTSMIPDRTRLLGFVVDAGMATVDLSTEFIDAPPRALAQVVFTATGISGATAVNFQIEGVPQAVSLETLSLVPADLPPEGATLANPVTRRTFEDYLSPITVESPALGATLSLPGEITGLAAGTVGEVLLQIVGEDDTLLWSGSVPACPGCTVGEITIGTGPGCPGCTVGEFTIEVSASAADGAGWATLRAYPSDLAQGPVAEYPVWLEWWPPPSATTTTTTTTAIAAGAAPWSAAPLAADAVPAVVADTWSAADNRDECDVLFPADAGVLTDTAVLHDRYFGGGWGLAWDLPSGPGRWEPGGDYCADCGREAFGVAGTGGEATGDEDSIWASRLEWGSATGPLYSHAGYGYEGLTSGEAGEPMLAYLFIDGQGCMYNVWSFLGEDHLLSLIEQLRFVEGMGVG